MEGLILGGGLLGEVVRTRKQGKIPRAKRKPPLFHTVPVRCFHSDESLANTASLSALLGYAVSEPSICIFWNVSKDTHTQCKLAFVQSITGVANDSRHPKCPSQAKLAEYIRRQHLIEFFKF